MTSDGSFWRYLGPGLLVAATGVGAGDLATGAFTGSELGVAILWAVLLGAGLKFALTEGLARWQIATGETLLEGALLRLGRPVQLVFGVYLLAWSWFVGSAMISGCGVTAHALLPVVEDPAQGKVVFGIACSLLGLVLVELGGYRLFEKLMRVCIGVMFVTVVVTACMLVSDWQAVARGIFMPSIPDAGGQGLVWTVALMGGVGGTLTVLCYGYWIREEGHDTPEQLGACRADLGVGYAVTAVFGLAMVIIGTTIEVRGGGSGLLVTIGEQLRVSLGETFRWLFLIGAFGAVFSSLLGVWQSVPYVFADFCGIVNGANDDGPGRPVDKKSLTYRGYLWALALVPMLGLAFEFREVQKAYAVLGALFMPMLALVLLALNGKADWVGDRFRNRWPTVLVLVAAVVLFGVVGWLDVSKRLG